MFARKVSRSNSSGTGAPSEAERAFLSLAAPPQVFTVCFRGCELELELLVTQQARAGNFTAATTANNDHSSLLSLDVQNFSGVIHLRLLSPTIGPSEAVDMPLKTIIHLDPVLLDEEYGTSGRNQKQPPSTREQNVESLWAQNQDGGEDERADNGGSMWTTVTQYLSFNSNQSCSRPDDRQSSTAVSISSTDPLSSRQEQQIRRTATPSSLSSASKRRIPSAVQVARRARAARWRATTNASGVVPRPTRLSQLLLLLSRGSNVTASQLAGFIVNPDEAATPDATGRLPLHVLGDHDELIRSVMASGDDGKTALTSFGRRLIQAYPEAMTTMVWSHMPFVPLVKDWVDWVEDMTQGKHSDAQRRMDVAGFLRDRVKQATAATNASVTPPCGPASDATAAKYSGGFTVPLSRVELWEEVEWCLLMLSTAVEVLRQHAATSSEQSPLPAVGESEYQIQHQDARCWGCEPLIDNLVRTVPNLIKALLATDEETVGRMFSSTVIRCVLFRADSVDSWLPTLLMNGSASSARGVDYLAAVSKLRPQDLFGTDRELSSGDHATFQLEKERLYNTIGSLKGMVGSLLVLEETPLEKALRTKIIWHIVSQKLSRPFVVSLVLIDLILHLTLMLVSVNCS